MTDARIDKRPRVLDFSTKISDVRAHDDLAWPCHAFRVTIPVRPTSRLNIFEETVLRLLDQAQMDVQALAETTCLDESLVTLVCCRLRDLGMTTDHHELTPAGRAQLSLTDDEPFEYEVRYVFRERISGYLLPIAYGGELRYEEIASWNDSNRAIKILMSDEKTKTLRMLRSPGGDGSITPPTAADVLRATNRHKELSRQYAALRLGVAPCPHVRHADQMNVDPRPESVFLRCRVVIPSAGDDYRIGDPFGYGFSDRLFDAYEGLRSSDTEEQRFIRKLRERASTYRAGSTWDATRDDGKAVIARMGSAVAGYHDLFTKLRHAEKELMACNRAAKSSAEEADFAYHGQQAVQSLFEALEMALALVVTRSRPAASEATLCGRGQSSLANGHLLEGLAQLVGFRARNLGGLLQLAPGRIHAIRHGSVDLPALVAVALAAAGEDDEHALRRMAARFEDWLLFVQKLKTLRDAGAHGQSRAMGPQRLEALREETYRSIEVLLPDLERTAATASPASDATSVKTAHDRRRQARSRLEDRFTIQRYVGLTTDVTERLLQVELASFALPPPGAEPVNVIRMITDLASVLQALTHARQKATTPALGTGEWLHNQARGRAVEAGLLNEDAELPRCLTTVNPDRLRQALQGQNPTLGASLVALLLLAPLTALKSLAAACPGFLDLCARVVDLRGHGNKPVFRSTGDALTLKEEVYAACAALMEN
jgi:hypothetical protein